MVCSTVPVWVRGKGPNGESSASCIQWDHSCGSSGAIVYAVIELLQRIRLPGVGGV